MTQSIYDFIAGQSVPPAGTDRYRAINPARPADLVADYALSSIEQVDEAVAAAAAAFKAWKRTSAMARADILVKAGATLRSRAGELGQLMTREMGKPVAEAVAEVDYAGKVLQYYAAEAQRPVGETLNSGRPNVHYYTRREPIGVIGAITPWNFPFSIACWKIGPALICGNTMVWKPSPQHPFCSQAIIEALVEAGLPAGVVNLVHGGPDVGEAMSRHPGIAGVTFTGSTAVGQHVYRTVSSRLARAQCEMGGKNALYVHSSADLDKAATLAVEGAFRSAGQKCTATSRVLVDASIEAEFTRRLIDKVEALVLGDPLDPQTYLGPLVDERQCAKVRGHVARRLWPRTLRRRLRYCPRLVGFPCPCLCPNRRRHRFRCSRRRRRRQLRCTRRLPRLRGLWRR